MLTHRKIHSNREIYRENLTEIDKPREMSIYYGYPNRVNNAPQFDVSEVQRKTILGDVEFDMRTGEWELTSRQ